MDKNLNNSKKMQVYKYQKDSGKMTLKHWEPELLRADGFEEKMPRHRGR